MSALQLLGEALEKGHGREFTEDQLKEIGLTLQGMQMEIANQTARTEALTRFAVVAVGAVGGTLDMTPDVYDAAGNYGLDVSWDEEGDIIHAKTYKVEVSEVRDEEDDTERAEHGDQPSLPGLGGAEVEVADDSTSEG